MANIKVKEGKRMFDNKCKLIDLQLHNDDGAYYLSAVYRHEDESGIYETTIPHICLFTRNDYSPLIKRPILHRKESLNIDTDMPTIDLGFGDLIFIKVDDEETGCRTDMITKLIEKKVKKMTLSEIEEKLGYKIELVSGEE